jgi:hypothetical protein
VPISNDPARLLEEWARTVDDFFKSCVELRQIAIRGDREELERAESEARELRRIAGKARRRYRSSLHRPSARGPYFEGEAAWRSDRRLQISRRKSS